MRVESAYGKQVCLEEWETPIMHNNQLWLLTSLTTINDIYFFFQKNSDDLVNIHVLTIPGSSPLRFTDESYAYHCIGKYLKRKIPKAKGEPICATFKLWNTSFITDLEEANVLSGYAKERDKEIFECLIITDSEWIEFIPMGPMLWEIHSGPTVEELVSLYLKKAFDKYA
jgi:hypothetical protein